MRKLLVLICSLFLSGVLFAKDVKVVTLEWQPFCGQTEGKNIHVEIAKAAFKAAGHNMKLTVVPWKRAMEESKEGKHDAIACAWHSAERQAIYHLVGTKVSNVSVMFKRKSDKISFDGDYKKLKKYKVGAVSGFAYPKGFKEAGFTLDYSNSDEFNLKKLVAKRVDLFFQDKIQILNMIKEKLTPAEAAGIDYVEGNLPKQELFVGFAKSLPGSKKLSEEFAKGMKIIEASGELTKILKSYGIN